MIKNIIKSHRQLSIKSVLILTLSGSTDTFIEDL